MMIIRKMHAMTQQRNKKVAAYARVSTFLEEQEESFDTQCNYYTKLILSTPGWELVKVYADQGRSGTSMAKRSQFLEMIIDAKQGKIDIILVKSISRFARNALEASEILRELIDHKVEVRFEREGISSTDMTTELLLNIMIAAAQEESRSISENIKWRYKKEAQNGVRKLGNNRILGYDEENGVLVPNGSAWIIKQIFDDYAAGLSFKAISQRLSDAGAKRLRSEGIFPASSIQGILVHEIYVGDRVLQKSAPNNYITKKPDPAVPYDSWFIRNDHMPIVSRDVWEKAQIRLNMKGNVKTKKVYRSSSHFMMGTVFCVCGQPMRRMTQNLKCSIRTVWCCKKRLKKKQVCSDSIIHEEKLIEMINEQLNWSAISENDYISTVDHVIVDAKKDGVRIEIVEAIW